MRKFMLFENVGNILSENMREIMEYIFEAWCHSFTDKKCIEFSKKTFESALVFSHRWWPRETWSWNIPPSMDTCWGHLFGSKCPKTNNWISRPTFFEVWRERCFILITVKGFNFFEVPLTRLTKPLNPNDLQSSFNAHMPGLPSPQWFGNEAVAAWALDGKVFQTRSPHLASREDGWHEPGAFKGYWECAYPSHGLVCYECIGPSIDALAHLPCRLFCTVARAIVAISFECFKLVS